MKKSEIEQIFKIKCSNKRLAKRTVECYTSFLQKFLSHFNDSPSNITRLQIEEYLGSLSRSQHQQMVGTLKILYKEILNCPQKLKGIKYPKKVDTVPEILSRKEVLRVIQFASVNIKHRVIIELLYGSGLRIGELLELKWQDVRRDRLQLKIRQGKGGKDRFTNISQNTLHLLENYYRSFTPKTFIIEGQNGGKYSASSVRALLRKYCKKAKVKKIHPHILRHSFATHLIEAGEPISTVQKLLGHKHVTTTEIYTHVATHNALRLLA